MNFFEYQESARRKTGVLIFFYILAIILIVLIIYLTFVYVLQIRPETRNMLSHGLWNPTLFFWVSGITLFIVAMGTFYKINQLSSGGWTIAKMLGGRAVYPDTTDSDERRLLNVIEEMAIASGVQVPCVFILDNEEGINAFAAGFSPNDAVIGVTSGCVRMLKRDELEGVIAHEFSHILNGDMRLNIRLMGVLHGILVIALLGYALIRSGMYSRSSSSRGGGGKIVVILLGLFLMVVGYIGVFFAKLIKSGVSRQREYLADASAVQFTRNPFGIANALKKIGGFISGSKIQNTRAEEVSHFFFANGMRSSFTYLLSTHPPLVERIRRIDPSFDGDFTKALKSERSTTISATGFSGFIGEAPVRANPEDIVSQVGTLTTENLEYASKLLDSLPLELRDASRTKQGARAVIYALLLSEDEKVKEIQIQHLAHYSDPEVYGETMRIAKAAKNLSADFRLPLSNMIISALRHLSKKQYHVFIKDVQYLVKADGKIDLFEYALHKMILRHLKPVFEWTKPTPIKYNNIRSVLLHCETVLSCLAHRGTDKEEEKNSAFHLAAGKLEGGDALKLLEKQNCGLSALDSSLGELAKAAPKVKKEIFASCVACIVADGWITLKESAIIRIIADSLDWPLPPMVMPGKFGASSD
ncbi:MAG: hypothetical protein COT16_01965 [Elusimicrobia bacterium CG08_land_8_20_14_0_20_44_26]|nr:MAG: hypothetical protein COT16_01965 [Elusimicrobia bacterium CG08_land_8_20_14_0_20_44_26]